MTPHRRYSSGIDAKVSKQAVVISTLTSRPSVCFMHLPNKTKIQNWCCRRYSRTQDGTQYLASVGQYSFSQQQDYNLACVSTGSRLPSPSMEVRYLSNQFIVLMAGVQVAVVWTEAVKLLLCLLAQLWSSRSSAKEHGSTWGTELTTQTTDILSNSLPMALPAALFVMQQASRLLL